jgi:transitional endoplasmic reticulum ATPase
MATGDEIIKSLREALSVSPNNIPLRQHLADTLLGYGRAAEAEEEYRAALALDAQNQALRIGLAKALFQQNQIDPALSIVENIMKHSLDIISAETYLLYARLLLPKGKLSQARNEYLKALDADPTVADSTLAEQLGLQANNEHLQFFHPENEDPAAEDTPSDVVDGRIRLAAAEEAPGPNLEMERPAITFADVGGMDTVKDDIRMKIIHPLTHPEIYAAYGKAIGGGILMYGPPGCGKTHLARATAGEVKAKFIPVGINDVLDMWLGNSERNLHEIFEQARRNTPCVLFFDEVDALGASRTDMRHSAGRHIINQFLSELDGVKASNEGVLILGATNAPWHLDSAFRRPGRFDRIVFVPPPDPPARAAILRIMLKGKPVKDVDNNYLAKKTKDFSGADLKAVVEIAVEDKLREAMKKGVPTPLATKDLQMALKQVKPSTKEWFATARNYAIYANQGGIYDDILNYLGI